MLRTSYHSLLLFSAIGTLACAGPTSPWSLVASADKTGWTTTARDGRVAFLDGAEASTDPSIVGVDLRVIDHDGAALLHAPTAGSARATALLSDAVATLEIESSVLDQRVVIRPLDGSTTVRVTHVHTPLALTATESGLAWIEATQIAVEDTDHDGIDETGVFALTAVESDARGVVTRRTDVTVEGGVRAPIGLLAPFPAGFGLVATGTTLFFGWGTRICNGRYEVFAIARDTGSAVVAWRGAAATSGPISGNTCQCADTPDNVTEQGEALALLDGELVVAGSIYACASVVATAGFVAHAGSTVRTSAAVRDAASDADGVLVSTVRDVFSFDGTLDALALDPPQPIRGLALDRDASGVRQLLVTTDDGVYRRAL